jgi:hypothetical protein
MGIVSEIGLIESSSEVMSSEKIDLGPSESPESNTSITLQFEHPVSLSQSHFAGSLNRPKSVFIGTKPNLCARPSSGKTDEFSIMSIVSIAKIGIPFRHIRLRAFAYCNGTPLSLIDILRSSFEIIAKEGKS